MCKPVVEVNGNAGALLSPPHVLLLACIVAPFKSKGYRQASIVCFKKKNVLPTTVSTISPWLLKRPNCNFSLCCYDKTATNPEVFKRKFFELSSEFSHHLEIYTDGSKDGIKTAAAVVAPNSVKTVRLPDNASILLLKFMHWTWR